MFGKMKNLSLIQKVMGSIAVPLISYLVIAGIWVSQNVEKYQHEKEMKGFFETFKSAGELISRLQIERGQSAVIVSSDGRVKNDFVKPQRSKVDLTISEMEDQMKGMDVEFSIAKKINSQLDDLKNIRKSVDENGEKSVIVSEYTNIIRALMKLRNDISELASVNVKGPMKGLTLMAEGQENAGLLRANLASISEIDYPIESNEMRNIIDFKAGLDNSLWSPVMRLSDSGMKTLSSFRSREHWQTTYKNFDTVMVLSQEGGYGLNSKNVFEMATLVVNDIVSLTKKEEKHIEQLMESEGNAAFWDMMKIVALLIANLVIIGFMLTAFSKSLRSNFNSLLQSLMNTINNVSSVSQNLSSTSQHLGSGSQEAAASIQETSSSMSEIKSMVNRTLTKANDTKDSTETVAEKVEHGNIAVNEMVDSMHSIKEANDRLEEVNRVIGSITKQTQVINEIVFKTQLLAVNASIESAKAGEAGKGFGVVAEEVSKLAQTSGEAASTISNLLDESNEKVTTLLSDVRTKVDHGSDTTKKVTEIFESIQQETQTIRQLSDDMSSACNEQDAGIQQISDAVVEIDESIQGNNKEAQTVDNLSSNLQGDIVNLQNVISQFTQFIYANQATDSVEKNDSSPMGEVKKFPSTSQNEETEDIDADDPSFKLVS